MISNDLSKIINILQKINNLPEKKFINAHEIKTEIENISDCAAKEFEYEKIMSQLSKLTENDLDRNIIANNENINITTKLLIDLHICLSDFIWHIEQVNRLAIEMIKQSK